MSNLPPNLSDRDRECLELCQARIAETPEGSDVSIPLDTLLDLMTHKVIYRTSERDLGDVKAYCAILQSQLTESKHWKLGIAANVSRAVEEKNLNGRSERFKDGWKYAKRITSGNPPFDETELKVLSLILAERMTVAGSASMRETIRTMNNKISDAFNRLKGT